MEVAGITTPLRDYRMAWLLNKHLKLGLHRVEDVTGATLPGGEAASFSRFDGNDALDKSAFSLISNRFSGNYLLPPEKAFDYFLLVQGGWHAEHFSDLLNDIRPLPNVQTVFHLQPPSVKQRLNLLLE